MPYYRRRRRRSRRRRRTYRRRRRTYRRKARKPATMRISHRRMPTIFPDNISVIMPFSKRYEYQLTAGVGISQSWKLNSILNPDITSTKKPLGYDQWSAFYNEYIVYASSIHMEFITDIAGPIEVAIGPDGNTIAPASIGHCKELPYYRTKVINGYNANRSTFGHKCSMKVIMGKRLGSELSYQAAFAANPGELKYWQFLIGSPFLSGNVDVRVTIHYKCRLLQRRLDFAQST